MIKKDLIKRRFKFEDEFLEKKYYVYYLINPLNNKIFYVGFGHNNRAYWHWKNFLAILSKNNNEYFRTNDLKFLEFLKIHKANKEPIVEFVEKNLEIFEGLALETKLIKKLGKRINKTGYLVNIVDDSYESPSIYKHISDKISVSLLRRYNSEEGDLSRERISKGRKRFFEINPDRKPSGERNPMFGYRYTDAEKKERSRKMIEVLDDPILREVFSKASVKNWIKWKENGEAERIIKKRSLKKRRRIICFNQDLSFIKVFNSYLEAGEKMSLSKSNISAASRGVSKQCGGYLWRKFDKALLRTLLNRRKSRENIKCKFFYLNGSQLTVEFYEEI